MSGFPAVRVRAPFQVDTIIPSVGGVGPELSQRQRGTLDLGRFFSECYSISTLAQIISVEANTMEAAAKAVAPFNRD